MKIIASVDEDRALVEITMDEVALILGFRGRFDDGFSSRTIRVGTEIPVDKIAATGRYMRTMDSGALADLQKQVESVLARVEAVRSTVEKINLFEDIRDPAE